MGLFENKTAFVTGAGSGIGRASAQAFAREGANVFVVDIDLRTLETVMDEIRSAGGRAEGTVASICSEDDVHKAVQAATDCFGGIDFAHNNAGIVADKADIVDTSLEQFRAVVEVNLFGTLICLKAQIPHMTARGGGTIVNTASTSGLFALPGLASYVASKHAVVGLTRAAALEAAAGKVRINSICPAVVETELSAKWFKADPALKDSIVAQHPAGWICQPENVADAVVWLCSDKSAYVLGSSLVIDGGYTIS